VRSGLKIKRPSLLLQDSALTTVNSQRSTNPRHEAEDVASATEGLADRPPSTVNQHGNDAKAFDAPP